MFKYTREAIVRQKHQIHVHPIADGTLAVQIMRGGPISRFAGRLLLHDLGFAFDIENTRLHDLCRHRLTIVPSPADGQLAPSVSWLRSFGWQIQLRVSPIVELESSHQ
jgi:hypothetical protein